MSVTHVKILKDHKKAKNRKLKSSWNISESVAQRRSSEWIVPQIELRAPCWWSGTGQRPGNHDGWSSLIESMHQFSTSLTPYQLNVIKLNVETSVVLFQFSRNHNYIRRRGIIEKGYLKGRGFFGSQVRGILPPSIFCFVELKMVRRCFVLAFAVSNFVRASKLS